MKKESVSEMVNVRPITTERILLNATLPQITLDFNRQIKLSNDGGSLSFDTGEFIFREFDEKLEFSKTAAKLVQVALASQPSLSRFFARFDSEAIE